MPKGKARYTRCNKIGQIWSKLSGECSQELLVLLVVVKEIFKEKTELLWLSLQVPSVPPFLLKLIFHKTLSIPKVLLYSGYTDCYSIKHHLSTLHLFSFFFLARISVSHFPLLKSGLFFKEWLKCQFYCEYIPISFN